MGPLVLVGLNAICISLYLQVAMLWLPYCGFMAANFVCSCDGVFMLKHELLPFNNFFPTHVFLESAPKKQG